MFINLIKKIKMFFLTKKNLKKIKKNDPFIYK